MPPEPLPWDRKDFFKERKHERSESLGSAARWRDSHQGSREFARWGSGDLRRPPGHGKQGGWHIFPEESGHGFVPSRPSDKMVEDESSRPFTSRGDGNGKYNRNNRENRGSFSQKDWKAHPLEAGNASPNMSGRSLAVNDQRSVDDMLTHSDFVNGWDQLQLKDQHDKMGSVNGLGTGQRTERENSLSSIDWKPLNKWTRSGSLSSRGSGFSHSSSSKSMGVDSNEARVDLQPRNVTPVQSPSGDAAACVASTAPSEETSSRKKPRLGWGEGLAKYEKKKVEGPDESVNRNGIAFCTSNGESTHSLNSNLADKSPRVMGFSDCASPATPSSVACSSSPGMEDKSFGKAGNVDNDTSNLSGSPGPVSLNHLDGFSFILESLELNQIANLGFSPIELLQSDDPSSVDSNFMRSTAVSKLLILKGDILKSVEMTESEIDTLENELKSLKSGSGSSCPCPAASSSFPVEGKAKPCEEQGAASNPILRPAPLQIVPSGDMITDKTLLSSGAMEDAHAEVKDEDIDSPGTATSKFVEPASLVKTASPSDMVNQGECSGNLKITRSTNMEVELLVSGPNVEETGVSTCGGGSRLLIESKTGAPVSGDLGVFIDEEDKIYNLILATNKDCANRASEVFNKLLPQQNQCQNDILGAATFSCRQNDSLIKQKFAMRKRFLRFKEKVVTLKFRVFQHLWKEDMRLLSIRKYRPKSQKKFELSSRTSHCGYQKHRSSIRSRFSSPAGNLSLVPTTEIINYTSKILSESQVKLCRNILKMPALILDKKEKIVSRFISSNGLVEDPCAVEKERTMINPWTAEEKEIFMDKLAIFGKDFKKIAAFLDHKTTADCVEFYYKNHKSDCFEKTKKTPELRKQGKSLSATTYLVTSGKKWNREMNAASLDMLGAASVMAARAGDSTENLQTCPGKFLLGPHHDYRTSHGDNGVLERSSSYDIIRTERETVAADVLAGICGSLSSEAMSSCITSSVDPGEGYRELKCQKVGSGVKRPLTPEFTQDIDEETCSDESCGEMDPADWTDEEKCIFMRAVSSYGKDFAMISRCVRTRSRDQCKVFFSKARKCLGLDLIHPGPNVGTPESDDANGGGSDTEDACVVEAGSVIGSNKSGSKMEEDSMLSVLNINPDESDFSGMKNLQTNLNMLDENNGIGQVDHKDDDTKDDATVTNLVSDECHQLEKTEQVFGDSNSLNGVDSKSRTLHVEKNGPCTKMEMDQESASAVEATDTPDRSNALSQAEGLTEGKELLLPETCLNVKREENNDADTSGQMLLKCTVKDSEVEENALHRVANSTSCPRFIFNSGYQHQVSVELDNQKPGVISLLQESSLMAEDSVPKDSSVIQCEKTLDQGISSSTLDLKETKDKQKSTGLDDYHRHLSGHCLLNNAVNAELAQKLGAYPLQTPPKEDMNRDLICKNPSTDERLSKLDRDIQSSHSLARDCYLQKCNGMKPQSLGTELPLLSECLEQTSNQTRAHGRSLSDTEKPSRNGDFKLFGQILSHPSSLQKPNSCSHENDDKGAHHPKLSSKSVNLKFKGHHSIDGNLAASKVDRNNYLSLENLPMSYGFWDGSRIQTGFSSLPDSAILLAKYPAAFSNYPMPLSAKTEQQPLQTVVKSNERNLNGLSAFPTRDMSSSNVVADYHQVFRGRECTKLQPFTVDMKQRQDLFSEMQRRSGFEAVSSLQAPGRGMVGMNVVGRGGGILVGGACTPSVSDPVAAIKMHYAKTTDQFGGQGGSIIRDDESWRGNGDIGR